MKEALNSFFPKTAICCMAKNEDYYINDWVSYHLGLGVDHIYIYDNNDVRPVGEFIDGGFRDSLTIIDVHGRRGFQQYAYNNCWVRHRAEYDWMAFIDCDEFITLAEAKSIKDVLSNRAYLDYDSIRLNWIIMSDDGAAWGDLGVPVFERFKTPSVKFSYRHNAKSIANCRSEGLAPGIHSVTKNGRLARQCHPNLKPAAQRSEGSFAATAELDFSVMYLRHYRTKTASEFKVQKMGKPSGTGDKVNGKEYFLATNDVTSEKEKILDETPVAEIRERLERTWTSRPSDPIVQAPTFATAGKPDFEIDYVFPMVNPFDPVWRKEYSKHFSDDPVYNPRHRKSPRLLRYMFRSVAKNMPWIDRMFMIVACPSQVPSWVNRETVNVVLHKDIIPEDELPTFNTCTIDKYVSFIPELSEHYVYANDDFYSTRRQRASQYFAADGRPVRNRMAFDVVYMTADGLEKILAENKWYACCRKSFDVLKNTYGAGLFKTFPADLQEPFYASCRHMPSPCVKSVVRKLVADCGIDRMKFQLARAFGDVMTCVVNAFYVSCTGADGDAPTNFTIPVYNRRFAAELQDMTQAQFNAYADGVAGAYDQLCINDNTDVTRALYAGWL